MFESKPYLGLSLVEATVDNGLLGDLQDQWRRQLERYGESEYAAPYMEYARDVVERKREDLQAGVYILKRGDSDAMFYEGMAHLNVAELPKTRGKTLRALWILLAPRFDFEDVVEEELAAVAAGFIYGGLGLAMDEPMRANHFKLLLKNIGDRKLAHGMAYSLQARNPSVSVAFKGNWLHIENVDSLEGAL